MIGLISGDIIASPYRSVPTEDYSSIFFPLFSSVESVMVDEGKRRAYSRTYEPKMTTNSFVALAATEWFLRSDKEGREFRDYLNDHRDVSSMQLLSVCGPLVRFSKSQVEARSLVGRIFAEMKSDGIAAAYADVLTMLMWRVKNDRRFDAADLRAFLGSTEGSVLPSFDSASDIRPFLEGLVSYGPNPGVLVPGSGKHSSDPGMYIVAAAIALSSGQSWEEGVRRAVAMGGDVSMTASITGALSEFRYGSVPEGISVRAMNYLDDSQRSLLNSADNILKSSVVTQGLTPAEINGRTVSVIRMPGMQSVFEVEPGDIEMIEAIDNSQLALGKSYRVVSPSEFRDVFNEMSKQVGSDGKELSGVFVENHRPEIRTLWLQDGKLRSATTRDGVRVSSNTKEALPSKAVRQRVFSEFQRFKAEVERMRTELERLVEYNPGDYNGRHLSFPSARYPVVYDSYVEIYENGICRGRCGLNADGLFSVDPNAVGYTFHGEGIEGVLNTRNFFTKGMNMKQCLAALNFFILDVGLSPDEEEAKHLKDNDEEAVAIRKKYRSNYDAVMDDMGVYFTRKEVGDLEGIENPERVKLLPEAVSPQGNTLSPEEMGAREERRAASEADYASQGITDLNILNDSKAHQGSVFSIGHSRMKIEDFVYNLKRHGIQVLCDVRSYRSSKFAPQFNETALSEALEKAGIEYEVFDSLGGHQKSSTSKNARELTYDEVAKRSAFKSDIDVLRRNARDGVRFVVMCSEGDPHDCHRSLLIGRALAHPEFSHPAETAAEQAKSEELQAKLTALVESATPAAERKARVVIREKISKLESEISDQKISPDSVKKIQGKIDTLKLQIKNLHNDNLAKIEKAQKRLDDFNSSRVYVPVDVEHIYSKGYVMSQQRIETDLVDSYSLLYKDYCKEMEDSGKPVLSELNFAYKAAETEMRDKSSESKKVRQRLSETSRMKKYTLARKAKGVKR